MAFSSPIFFLFIALTVTVNYFLAGKTRLWWQLFASLVFIAFFNTASVLVVLFSAGLNYFLALSLEKKKSIPVYAAGLAINLSAILLFNYFISTGEKIRFGFSLIGFNTQSFILALGLSFYSLQHIAYLADVYRKNIVAEKRLLHYLLATSFFPKISSGPVTLAQEFLPQPAIQRIKQEQLVSGFQRFLLGLFKKLVIADRLAPGIHSVFDFGEYPGATVLAGAFLFTVQLYFDFSGYTDMALGTAKMLGYELPENFNLPFRSSSISEFWRRWHISLIRFFTTYVFYPLSFRLRKYKRLAAFSGIWITFLLSALWHGIGLTFLCWALCHIVYLCIELFTKKRRALLSEKIPGAIYKPVSICITLLLVSFSNIFFRAQTMGTAKHMVKALFCNFLPGDAMTDLVAPIAVGGQQADQFNLVVTILLLSFFLCFEKKINAIAVSEKIRPVYVFAVVLLIVLFGVLSASERFIYMQF